MKGMYDVLTTFFFITIIIVAALTLVFFGNIASLFSHESSDELEKYTIAGNARDRLYFCYGKVMSQEYLDQGVCRDGSEAVLNPNMVKGYRIVRLNATSCNASQWGEEPLEYDERFVYMVPVQNGTMVCLGRMEVYV